jgi:hypothetical protein
VLASLLPGAANAAVETRPAKPLMKSTLDATSASAKARSTGAPVEVTASTNETSLLVANPSGSFTLTENSRPVRVYRDSSWVPVDLTLTLGSDGSVAAAAAPTPVAFSGGGTGPLVRIGSSAASMSLSWPGGSLPTPTLVGDTATYPNVLPDIDLRMTADVDGYGEVLIVKTPSAAANPALKTLRFGMTATGVTASKDRNGNLDFRDSSGAVVFHAPTPTMWDTPGVAGKVAPRSAAGTDVPSDEPTRATMGVQVSAGALTIIPDQAMLTGSDTQFPVYLDPSVSAGRRAWTTVWQKFASISYWNSSEDIARVGHESDEGNTNRSLFWLATQTVNHKHILSATFRADNIWSYSCNSRPVDLWLTGGISSSTTWNSQPTWIRKIATANGAKGYSSSCPGGYLEFNALSAIQQQAAAGWPGVTLGLRANESDTWAWKKFKASPTAIVIEYNTIPSPPTSMSTNQNKPCVIGATRPTIGTTTPIAYATLRDADAGQNLRARFQWWIANGSMKGEFLTSLQSANGTTFQAQIPSGLFADGNIISWRVRAEDGTDVGDFGTWCEYRVDATHPDHAPTVTSADFPADGSVGKGVGRSGTFTFGPTGVADVVEYAYTVNSGAFDEDTTPRVPAAGPGLTGTLPYTPTKHDANWVTVWSLDAAGNPSPATQYLFLVNDATSESRQWLLNDGSGGTAADSSATGGHSLTLPAAGTAWSAGREGLGLQFGAGAQAATTDTSVVDSRANLTMSAWVALSSISTSSTVLAMAGSRASSLSVGYSATSHLWVLTATSADNDAPTVTTASGGPAPTVGIWTHIAAVYDPGAPDPVGAAKPAQLRLYVNGALAASAALPALWAGGGKMRVGADLRAGASTVPLQGTIDDVRAWDRVLTDEEIIGGANEAVLAGAWGFDEGSGSVTADTSGHGRSATLTNAGWAERPPGYAMLANGTNGSAATSGPVVRTDRSYTVSAWVQIVSSTSSAAVAAQTGTRSNAFSLQYKQDTNQWSFAVPTADTDNPSLVRVNSVGPAIDPDAPDTYVFLTASYDAPHKQVQLYVNGEGPVTEAAPATMWNATGPLRMGAALSNGSVTNFWPGQIDDVRLYAGVLTNQQIRDMFTADS